MWKWICMSHFDRQRLILIKTNRLQANIIKINDYECDILCLFFFSFCSFTYMNLFDYATHSSEMNWKCFLSNRFYMLKLCSTIENGLSIGSSLDFWWIGRHDIKVCWGKVWHHEKPTNICDIAFVHWEKTNSQIDVFTVAIVCEFILFFCMSEVFAAIFSMFPTLFSSHSIHSVLRLSCALQCCFSSIIVFIDWKTHAKVNYHAVVPMLLHTHTHTHPYIYSKHTSHGMAHFK